MEVLILNSAIYWGTTFFYYRKYGVSLISFLWLYYSVFTVFGVLLMVDDLYFRLQEINPSEEMHLMPYIYIYVTFQLITLPLRNIRQDSILYPKGIYDNLAFLNICRFLNIIAILYVIVKISQLFMVIQIGFGAMHDLGDDSIVYPGVIGVIMRILNLIGRINNMIVMPIVVFYVLNGYANGKFSGKYVTYMTLPYIMGVLLMGFVGGSRGAIFFGLLSLTFYYVLFFKSIPKAVHLKIWLPMLGFIFLAYTVSVMIASYRFDIDVNDSILSYLGQMWPNANYEVWEHSSFHPMGKRLFPMIFGSTGFDSDDWFYVTDIKGWIFVTVWGTLYTEFGEYIPMLFFCGVYLLFNFMINKKDIFLYEVGLLSYIYFFCFSSLFGLSFTQPDYIGLMLTLFLIWYMKRSIIGNKLFG